MDKVQSMKDRNDKTETEPVSMGRRALLRRGLTAMPAILTLQSGAALARTSNLVSAAPTGTTIDGYTYCLDTNSVYPATESGQVYDLGEPPRATVNRITPREYHIDSNRGSAEISEGVMCEQGGVYYYKDTVDGGWKPVELPYRGIVISNGAWVSIAAHSVDPLI